MRGIPILLLFSGYVWIVANANAQDFDPTINISNQVDENVSRTLQAQSGAPPTTPVTPSSGNTTEMNAMLVPTGSEQTLAVGGLPLAPKGSYLGEYSGFSTAPIDLANTPILKPREFLLQQSFNDKSSFTGMGVTDTYNSQVGIDIVSKYGTDIQPFFVYQQASRDLVGTTTYRLDGYGGSLGITQKIFPLIFNQPSAVYNLRGLTDDEKTTLKAGKYIEDIYPNFDANLAFNFSGGTSNISTLTKRNWINSSQNAYSLSPGLVFDFYFKQAQFGTDKYPETRRYDKYFLLPAAISIVPTYTDQMVMANNGTTSSNGLLSIQDRNTYVFGFNWGQQTKNVGCFPGQTLELTESNTWLTNTNQEPLTPPTSSLPYQNWAKFGLAVAYRNKEVPDPSDKGPQFDSVKVEYTYEAFNTQYGAQNVTASLNIKF